MTKARAIAWDIDGTLVDSEPLHHLCLTTTSMRYGVNLGPASHEQFIGRDMDWTWQVLEARFPPKLTFATWRNEIIDAYVNRSSSLVAQPFVLETMQALRAAGIRQVCVSNSERIIVDANLSALGIRDLLEFSISRDDVAVGKPDPTPYLEACRRLDCVPLELVAIEDSQSGLQSAQAAGLRTIFIACDECDLSIRRKAMGAILDLCGVVSSLPIV
ncbi:HAD family phosphatase [Bradyrhizobium sp. SSUT18]|uniref:HAD family hydrolase n=1 Tax=Bradyrhizobium sp. SSUT18 TaxID=3040602 RepID=UPI0024491EA7|nr:HAD family phosphatase [Bradyrhizobium sp. SSUT18]MDH2406635.1 HAD family phosphatase [Bradyrhizobium sp. SSUT18]